MSKILNRKYYLHRKLKKQCVLVNSRSKQIRLHHSELEDNPDIKELVSNYSYLAQYQMF